MGRLLGLDYGRKRIGLAVTDEIQMLSSPLDTYLNDSSLDGNLLKLHRLYCFEKVVLGYPFSETHKEASLEVEKFAERIRQLLKIEVVFQNEEFSSVYAESFLKSIEKKPKKIKSQIDKFAAQKILSDYLSSIRP